MNEKNIFINLLVILRKTFLAASFFCACGLALNAQRTLTGTVSDGEGPLPGVSVVVKGTTQGVATNEQGTYAINVADDNAVMQFILLGYSIKEVPVEGRTQIDVVLELEAEEFEQVVVTALGMTRAKKALGYAMTEIKGEDIMKSNVVNPINGLQGKVAGVQIDMGSAGPQSSQRILIRGNTSISGNNQPIFVIDGIIIDNEETKGGSKTDRDFGNDLKNLNADDFESVSVLKGAAATALYGSRASNGVILITTKKGKRGEGLGISFSHTQQWENIYGTPDLQNEFGMGSSTVWNLNDDGSENRNLVGNERNFGPRYDGKPYKVGGVYDGIYRSYDDNLKEMYRTGRYVNTNVAVSGGSDKGSFRFSYSNLQNDGISLNNSFARNNFSLNATQDISKIVTAEAGFNYVTSEARNPTYQGGDKSPVYDFAYNVPREYDTKYWKQNYWNANHNGFNANDPFGYSATLFDYLENNQIQKEENYRGYLNAIFKIADWITFTAKGDMNQTYKTFEKKILATENADYRGAEYQLNESKKQQYKVTAMLSANRKFGDLSVGAFVATERFNEEQSYHNSKTNNGLRVPGVFELNNSIDPATTDAFARTKRKRINSIYGAVNADWKGQLYLDLTGRNDWSSTLRYADGSGNVSYFYPSVSASWLLTETLRSSLPKAISFAKLRASYTIVGNDCAPYLITDPGVFEYYGSFNDERFATGNHPYFKYSNGNLGALDLKPEKSHAIEVGFDLRLFKNRLGIDFAYYKTNTKNQILELATSTEAGVAKRIINAGNIQNSGIELLLTGKPIQTDDWLWDVSLTFTRNRNKIISLYPGVDKYELKGGGQDTKAWATAGGAYGDIYTSYAFKRDAQGRKLLTNAGLWERSVTSEKVGSMQPDFLSGLSSSLTWKSLTLSFILDSRFGGQVFSASYNYGMAGGRLKSSLAGRTAEYGGLKRTLDDGRIVYDGMIPEGVFREGSTNKDGVNMSGMTYQEAYDKGYVNPLSASDYYRYLYEWTEGIREASIFDLSWIALREVALHWSVPKKWLDGVFVKGASLGFVVRNVGYLYNSLPDNIHPEGLQSNYSSEYVEAGGNVYSRNYGLKINLNF